MKAIVIFAASAAGFIAAVQTGSPQVGVPLGVVAVISFSVMLAFAIEKE